MNNNLPVDKQGIDRITDYEYYVNFCVKHGGLSEDEAERILESKGWEAVEKMMDYADYMADLAIEREWEDRVSSSMEEL